MTFHRSSALAALIAVSSIFATDAVVSTASAKQCVWNKAGFVLGVAWYRKSSLVNGSDGKLYLKPGARHVQKDVFPIGQGRCNNSNEIMVAVLKAEGAEWIKKGLVIGATTVVGIAGATACVVGTAGTTCPAVAGAVAATAGGLMTASGEFIPDPKQLAGEEPGVFKIVTPSTSRWLDVWGTAWDPQTGPGGNL